MKQKWKTNEVKIIHGQFSKKFRFRFFFHKSVALCADVLIFTLLFLYCPNRKVESTFLHKRRFQNSAHPFKCFDSGNQLQFPIPLRHKDTLFIVQNVNGNFRPSCI